MLKKTIKYTDYNGVKRSEDFWFNFNEAELMEMELSTSGGLTESVNKIINSNDIPAIIKIFKDIIFKAYGEKSPDGRRFIKSEEKSKEFSQTEAYSKLFMELSTNVESASEFVNGVIAVDIHEKIANIDENRNLAMIKS